MTTTTANAPRTVEVLDAIDQLAEALYSADRITHTTVLVLTALVDIVRANGVTPAQAARLDVIGSAHPAISAIIHG